MLQNLFSLQLVVEQHIFSQLIHQLHRLLIYGLIRRVFIYYLPYCSIYFLYFRVISILTQIRKHVSYDMALFSYFLRRLQPIFKKEFSVLKGLILNGGLSMLSSSYLKSIVKIYYFICVSLRKVLYFDCVAETKIRMENS